MGVNAASKNKADAKKFLEWLTTPEFAELYANALPGFFPLSKAPVTIKDPLAAEMVGWRKDCKSTIRNSYQILNRGHAEPRERALERLGAGHQRRADARRPPASRRRPTSTSCQAAK